MRTEKEDAVLGLFPSVSAVGGVEVSGRIAIDVLNRSCERNGEALQLLFYGKNAGPESLSRERICTTPFQAVSFVRGSKNVRHVFVWHLSMLRLVAFLRRKPESITVFLHGIEAWKKHSWLTRSLLRRVDLFLSNSDFTWTKFVESCPEAARSPHKTVGLGVDTPYRGGIPAPDATAVLMIGRMLRSEDYKGHKELIHAWPGVLRCIPEAELWIAGDGDLRPDLEFIVSRLGLHQKVRFWGLVSDEEKQQLLLRCRCLAMPSRGEGFGIAYLEAMRVGRPCLVSRSDAGHEVVNPPVAGLSADVSDPKQLADAVCRLLASETGAWASWSEGARRRYEDSFTAAHFEQRLTSALETILSPASL